MASLMLAKACSRVSPWLMQPGSVGHSATKTPSSSGSIMTRNFMSGCLERPPQSSTCLRTGSSGDRRRLRRLDGFDGIDAVAFAHSAVHLEFHLFAWLMVQERLGHGGKIADDALLRIGIPSP